MEGLEGLKGGVKGWGGGIQGWGGGVCVKWSCGDRVFVGESDDVVQACLNGQHPTHLPTRLQSLDARMNPMDGGRFGGGWAEETSNAPAWWGCEERAWARVDGGRHQEERRGREQNNLAFDAEPVKPEDPSMI